MNMGQRIAELEKENNRLLGVNQHLTIESCERIEQLIAENERLKVYAPATLETGTVTSRLQKRVWDLEAKLAEQDKEMERLRGICKYAENEYNALHERFVEQDKEKQQFKKALAEIKVITNKTEAYTIGAKAHLIAHKTLEGK